MQDTAGNPEPQANVTSFTVSVPGHSGDKSFSWTSGSSVCFVGANGSGKTRLAVHIETQLGIRGHRISAQRALALRTDMQRTTLLRSQRWLRYGNADVDDANGPSHRMSSRWNHNRPGHILSDFDPLIQSLYADQTAVGLASRELWRGGVAKFEDAPRPKLELLQESWQKVLPTRTLEITTDDIFVIPEGGGARYSASEMSDGERAVFYLLGQALMAASDVTLILDEPELHIHRSIMAPLLDELEFLRPDCAYVLITHDLELAASRVGQKFVVTKYSPSTQWTIEDVPEADGFSEELTTMILGSRHPILFVEGDGASLDSLIYRVAYPERVVVQAGPCEHVIHAVQSLEANPRLTRIECRGVIDADGRDANEKARLNKLRIAVLPVEEIENILLLPEILSVLCSIEKFDQSQTATIVEAIKSDIFESCTDAQIDSIVLRRCKRNIDRQFKELDFKSLRNAAALADDFAELVKSIDVKALADATRQEIAAAIQQRDLPALLALYDQKSLVTVAARHIRRNSNRDEFINWIRRCLSGDSADRDKLVTALRDVLPALP